MAIKEEKELSGYSSALNSAQIYVLGCLLGTYLIPRNTNDPCIHYKPIFDYLGIYYPPLEGRSKSESLLLVELGEEVVKLIAQHQILRRFYPNVGKINSELNFGFFPKFDTVSPVYIRSRLEWFRKEYGLDEHGFPKHISDKNELKFEKTLRKVAKYLVFIDSINDLSAVPPKSAMEGWRNVGPVKIFRPGDFSIQLSVERNMSKHNVLLIV